MVGLLVLPAAAAPARAQELAGTPLPIGAPAQITYANGQDVLLRAAPGYDQAVVSGYGEGTPVEIVEGPLTAADGSTWYGVVVGGQQGYLAADFLTSGAAAPAPAMVETAPAPDAVAGTEEVAVAQPATAPAPSAAYAVTDLNLRAGPNAGDPILLVVPGGAPLTTTGEASNGYLGVVYAGQTGWADAAYVGAGAPAAELATTAPAPAGYTGAPDVTAAQPAPADTSGIIADPAAAPAGTGASVNALVNLRGGPSDADAILRVLPAGSPVTITGAESNGYLPVWYNGTTGWIASQFITGSGATAETAPSAAAPTDQPAVAAGSRMTSESVNLRAEPAVAAEVIGVIPGGVALTPLAGPENGYYQVTHNGLTGWVPTTALGDAGTPDGAQTASGYTTGPNLEAADRGGGLIWPVPSGRWTIMQGYNGSSHQDQNSTWQYYYSLDLVRSDGDSAGQPVLAPATGTVRWLDPSSGGISIDIGNGHAVALFHVAVDPGLRDGMPVQQGQTIGRISGPGGPGFAGTPHVHFTLWQTTDGGNWSRDAVPFTGRYAIAGREFPDIGGSNQYRGTEIDV